MFCEKHVFVQAGANLKISKYEHSNTLCIATLYRRTVRVQYFLYSGAKPKHQSCVCYIRGFFYHVNHNGNRLAGLMGSDVIISHPNYNKHMVKMKSTSTLELTLNVYTFKKNNHTHSRSKFQF